MQHNLKNEHLFIATLQYKGYSMNHRKFNFLTDLLLEGHKRDW